MRPFASHCLYTGPPGVLKCLLFQLMTYIKGLSELRPDVAKTRQQTDIEEDL